MTESRAEPQHRGAPIGRVQTVGRAAALHPPLIVGAAAVIGLIIVQRLTLARPPRPAKVLGVRQMALGMALVVATALGVWIGSG
jgi:apolipoprotein N-acyltransferase